MALTFVDLQDKVLGWLDAGDHETADADLLTRVKEALAEADVERSTERKWRFMVAAPTTFTLTPGTRDYSLSSTFRLPIYFWNQTRNAPMVEMPVDNTSPRDFSGAGLLSDYNVVLGPQESGFILGYQSISLTFTPSSADVVEYQFYKLPVEMSADADLPNVPYPHSRVLIYDALLRLAVFDDDLSPAKRDEWKERQQKYDNSLIEAHAVEFEQSQYSSGRYIHYIPRD